MEPFNPRSELSNFVSELVIGFKYHQRAALTKWNSTISEQMISVLENQEGAEECLEATLHLFEQPGVISRNEIDIPLLMVTAAREGGSDIVFSLRDRLIISAGRDTHPQGVSGLDFLYNARSLFPEHIQQEIHLVNSGYVEGRENRQAAWLPEKYLLAAVAVWIERMERDFERRVHDVFGSRADEVLGNLSLDAQRAWSALGFAGQGYVQDALEHLSRITASDSNILNNILTNETLRGGFHVRGAIVNAARAWMFEQMRN